MSCELQLRWWNAHFEEIVIVGGSLSEIQSSGHDCKPLHIFVNDEIDYIFIPRHHITAAAATNEWWEAKMGLFLSKNHSQWERGSVPFDTW
jgi:hypothetical protein